MGKAKKKVKEKAVKSKKSKKRPMLFGGARLEIIPIPAHVKRSAKGREITILNQPFKMGFSSADDWECSENSEIYIVSQELTSQQLALIKQTVGSYSMDRIEAFLTMDCNLHDVTDLTWTKILSYMEHYLHSQEIGQADDDTKGETPMVGIWTKPASKSEMMRTVNIFGYKKFNSFIKGHKIKILSRKCYQLCLDKMDPISREKLLNM